MDADPAIFVIDLQDASKKIIFQHNFSAYYFLKVHLHHFSKIKSQKESQNSRHQRFSYYFGIMIEGSGSGSGRPKNRWIRIRIRNTAGMSNYAAFNVSVCVEELGRCLFNLVNVIPAGMVVFFPSYDYEELVYKHLGMHKHSILTARLIKEIGPSKLQIFNGSVTPGLRIRIRIGSVFYQVRGSGSRREKMTHKSRNN
jgi:hypothetical protein